MTELWAVYSRDQFMLCLWEQSAPASLIYLGPGGAAVTPKSHWLEHLLVAEADAATRAGRTDGQPRVFDHVIGPQPLHQNGDVLQLWR